MRRKKTLASDLGDTPEMGSGCRMQRRSILRATPAKCSDPKPRKGPPLMEVEEISSRRLARDTAGIVLWRCIDSTRKASPPKRRSDGKDCKKTPAPDLIWPEQIAGHPSVKHHKQNLDIGRKGWG